MSLNDATSASPKPGSDVVAGDSSASSGAAAAGSDGASTPARTSYTLYDVFGARPRTLHDRWQRWLYMHDLGDMPVFMKAMYNKTSRKIFVNWPLSADVSSESHTPLMHYPRNKIRTTKYTPLSFLPKNLLIQFSNVANSYFLLLIILGAFQVFGVPNPGLAAVPLIVIVCITAIKDAFEDYKRASSDGDLNNSPIHLLVGLDNPNVVGVDDVGAWRRFKKGCTRATHATFRALRRGAIRAFGGRRHRAKLARERAQEEETALRRVSTVVSDYSGHRPSVASPRPSMASPRPSMASPRPSMASPRRSTTLPPPPPPSQPTANTVINPAVAAQRTQGTSFKNRCWKDIHVGDYIRVRANEEVPADVIVVSTSDVEGNCYIETKNLDGESNLKNKTALKCGGSGNVKHANDLGSTKFWVECDPPNGSLYTFKGTVHYEHYDDHGALVNGDEREAVTADQLLLRGSTLRNTKWVIGLVIYTGDETKIMINSGITPTKKSRISKELNLSVIINFAFLFILCFISGVVNGVFYDKDNTSRHYFDLKPYGTNNPERGILAFFVALIIYQSLVPISLYISVEIVKTLQALFIYSDLKMYYEKLDFPCVPKSWNISDDLGQIEYVFSDKTGTLTQNVMEFKKCTVNGVSYGLAYTEAQQGMDKREGKDPVAEGDVWRQKIEADKRTMLANLNKYIDNSQLRPEAVTFCSSKFVEDTVVNGDNDERSRRQKEANESFMLALALCHTVVTEENAADPQLRDFKAESPDEAALVAVARDMGVVFKERLRKSLVVDVYGNSKEYKLLETIGFTSSRKRMSQVIETPEGKIFLLSKGADNVIFQRLAASQDNEVISKTALHLEAYANEGLRTLCIARRELDRSYALDWLRRYKEAAESLSDDRDEVIERLDEELEVDLQLLGGTAIEDRLQEGVPDSISILADAGIKLWVLTGDRIETAINIGFSCNLLGNDMSLLVVRPDESDMENAAYIEALVTKHLEENFGFKADSEAELNKLIHEAKKDHNTPSSKYALIIDGAALSLVFGAEIKKSSASGGKKKAVVRSTSLQKKFLLLGKRCKSVLCCRVSPAQKASVVKIVRDSLGVMTLAIGDGANDVAMIQAANVGVGIAGEEGRQAVMSSDYAIGQFRFLTRLLLVHGRWSYKRLAEMVPSFFYKNVVFTLTCFWYGIFNDYDGSYLYEYTYLMFFNLAFTSLPIIFLAVLDQDVSDTVSLLVPQLYRSGILRLEWSQYKFIYYMLDGLYQSVISFFFPYLLFYKSFQNPQGLIIDHRFWIGVVAACISVTAADVYVLLRQYRWDWLTLLIDAISVLLVYFWTGVWSVNVYAQEFYRAGAQVFGTLGCWCCIFIGVLLCLLPRFVVDFIISNFHPKDVDIIREQARNGAYDNYPVGFDPTNKDDLERHRLGLDVPTKLDLEGKNSTELSPDAEKAPEHHNPITRTLQSIKRKTTLKSKTRPSSQPQQPPNLAALREQMIRNGEYASSGLSLNRINTTHDLPGLAQADTLLSYHTRNSIQLDRQR